MSKKQPLFVAVGNDLPYSFVEITVRSPLACETQIRPRIELAVFDLSGFNRPSENNVFARGPISTG